MALWAVLPLALQGVLRQLDPATLTWFRFVFSSLALAAFLGARGRLPALRALGRVGWLLLGVATLGLAANYIAYLVGLAHTGEASAQVLIQMAPILLSLGGIAVFGERYTRLQWLGLAVLVAGLALFSWGQLSALAAHAERYRAGVALMGFAAVTWAGYGLAQKQLLHHLAAPGLMLLIYVGCALCFTPFARPAALARLDAPTFALLVFCAANTLLAYGAFAAALSHWDASRVSAVLSLGPPTTLALAWLAEQLLAGRVVAEPVARGSLVGTALVVAGSLASSLGGRRASSAG